MKKTKSIPNGYAEEKERTLIDLVRARIEGILSSHTISIIQKVKKKTTP